MTHSTIHVLHELLRRGLIGKMDLLNGNVSLADSSSRHRNTMVMRRDGPSYFVKEAVPTQPLSVQTLAREAATYRLVHSANGPLSALAQLMPKFHVWDPVQHLLVLELLPGAESLGAHARRTHTFSESLAGQFGRALATYHRRSAGTLTQTLHGHIFPCSLPWALTAPQHTQASVANLSAANAQTLGILQRYPNFPLRLNALQASWRRDTLIHGDMKFENCVVTHPGDEAASGEIKVVDWEIADIGDARWDVGSMLQSWLAYWIFSMPAESGTTDPAQLAATARYPLERMRPAVRAFWNTYVATLELRGEAAKKLLESAMSFGGARMIQTVFESMYQMPQLTAHAILMLQVSLNILEEPQAAVSELLGL